VTTVRETVTLPSRSGRALVDQIRGIDSARAAVAAFERAGAGGAVSLDVDAKWVLVEVIRVWGQDHGLDVLPEGLWRLRSALIDDLHDAARSP
jgi:hypothetical protein